MKTRREFIKNSLVGLAATLPLSSFLGKTALAVNSHSTQTEKSTFNNIADPILVVLQLSGGNDGLNTVIPYAHDAYYQNRPNLGIPANKVLKLTDELGLHPQLAELNQLYHSGNLALINGVGYPDPNLSHFCSMQIWQTADLTQNESHGWLGKYFDLADSNHNSAIGLHFEKTLPPAMQSSHPLEITTPQSTRTLSAKLQNIARLISDDSPARVYYINHDGFDTHAAQLETHSLLLGQLDKTLHVFCNDLKAQGNFDRVLIMTFSEFGRQARENAFNGTDHGTAGPMFVIGGKIKGGIYGNHPNLTNLEQSNLIYQTDFRSVYATVLDHWLKTDSTAILKQRFSKLNFV